MHALIMQRFLFFCFFVFLIHRSHSISFTRAQGIPKYKIRFGREKDGKVGDLCTCVRVPGLPTEQGNEEEKINRDDEDMYEDSAGVGLKPQPLPGEEDALQLGA